MVATTKVVRFDHNMYHAALAYYRLPRNYNRFFTLDYHGKLISCNPIIESGKGRVTWVQVNQPRPETPLNKAKNRDIHFIANITLDFEHPPEPARAHRIGLALAEYLVERGLAEEGLPVEDSGAGCHIVLPIPPIETTPETAEQWNKAVYQVVKKYIEPEFKRLAQQEGIPIDLGGFDISRILSLPGTWRPSAGKKGDCDYLKSGYLRRWLPPFGSGNYPHRFECKKLSDIITEEFTRLSEPAKTVRNIPKPMPPSSYSGQETPSQWLAIYAREHVTEDRSGSFQSLVNGLWLKFGDERIIWSLKDELNDLSGGKYNGRLDSELERSLALAKKLPREEKTPAPIRSKHTSNGNHPPTSPDAQNEPLDTEFVLDCLKQDEWGDAILFAHLFRGKVVYDHTAKEWYLFEQHYWQPDTLGKVRHYVSGQLASIYLQATATLTIQASESSDDATTERLKTIIKQLTNRALLLRKVARNNNVLTFAASQEGMGITSEQWDTNAWLLPVQNGVIDLRTGTRRVGKPEDYIRTFSPAHWEGLDVPAPRWERLLSEVFEDRAEQDRTELIAFLQRLFGYGITGITREHVFCVLYGDEGRNGKDTLIKGIENTLGSLAGAISNDVLLASTKHHNAGGATPHIGDLQGLRLAWASEPEKGARFDIAQVKQLTGGGTLTTRGLYEKKYTKFEPTHLLILLTNHKPHADATDRAFWERLRLITFNMRFVDNPVAPNERKRDVTLWKTLQEEASGILAWLVRGCLQWQAQGLNAPQSVLKDVEAYQQEEDNIALFLDECCVLRPDLTARASKLFEKYHEWCKFGNMHSMSSKNFGVLVSKRFAKVKDNRGWYYQGVGLLSDGSSDPSDGSHHNPSLTPKPLAEPTQPPLTQPKVTGVTGELGKSPSSGEKNLTQDTLLQTPVTPVTNLSNNITAKPLAEPTQPHVTGQSRPVTSPVTDRDLAMRKARGYILAQNPMLPGETKDQYAVRIDVLLSQVEKG